MAVGRAGQARRSRAWVLISILLVAVVLMASLTFTGGDVGAQADGLGPSRPLTASIAGAASGRIDPGMSCAEGGEGGYWHYDAEDALEPGTITGAANPLTGTARLHVDVHSEQGIVRSSPEEPLPGEAWLQGTESAVTLANQRGTVRMRLRSVADGAGATCDTARTLAFDGTTVTGDDLRWEITEATGSYRKAAGEGTAALTVDVAPGADNPAQIDLTGTIAVLQPGLQLEVVDSYWAFLGAHYLKRYVTVIYRVTNTGPGDAFGVRLTAASSPTQGVKLVGPLPFDTSTRSLGVLPQHLADLGAGESTIVRLRWGLPNPSGDPPCEYVILDCEFDTTLTFEMPDALDEPGDPRVATVEARAPSFPPPVVD